MTTTTFKKLITTFGSPVAFIMAFCIATGVPQHALAAAWVSHPIHLTDTFDSIALSGDGTYAVAGDYEGGLYVSSDGGANWNEAIDDTFHHWTSVAISDDGQYMAAVQNGGYIWLSPNAGAGWFETGGLATSTWQGVTMTGDGEHMAAISQASENPVYSSDDFGSGWAAGGYLSSWNWKDIAYSAEGDYLYATAETGQFARSFDMNQSWNEGSGPRSDQWYGIAAGESGKVALAGYSIISTSLNGGSVWSDKEVSNPYQWNAIAMSDDMGTILAGGIDGSLYLSRNSGLTWQTQSGPGERAWKSVSVSSDGTHLAAVGAGGNAWFANFDDTTSPTVESISPTNDATDVSVDTSIVITFSESMDTSTTDITLSPCGTSCAVFDSHWNEDDTVLTLTNISIDDAPLANSTRYTVDIASAKDLAGNDIENEVISAFTTVAAAASETTHHSSGGHGSSRSTPSTEWLQAQIDALLAQLKALGIVPAAVTPDSVRNLDVGMTGTDVTALQTLLLAQGYSIPAGATGFFAEQTKAALAKYQVDHGITPAVGYFGIKTRTQMKTAGLSGLWW